MTKRLSILILLVATLLPWGAAVCQGQVRIDLRTQSRNVDFGQASSTRPFQTGPILPLSCQEGEAYYLTTAMAGQNIHLCQGAGTWVKVATDAASAGAVNYTQSFSGATSVTLQHGAGTGNVVPFCVDANGDAMEWNSFRIVDSDTAVVTFSVPQTGRCVVNGSGAGGSGGGLPPQSGENGKVLLTNGANAVWSEVSRLQGRPVAGDQPLDGQALVWSDAAGRWAPGAVAGGGGAALAAGAGIVISSGSTQTVSVDVAVVPTYLTAAMTLTFGSIANATCKTASFSVTGALNGDSVAAGWPNTLETGLMGMMLVTAPDTVTVRLCNHSGATVTPANQTYRATIVRTF